MELNLINIKLPRIILTACLLLFVQQLSAQDSSSSGNAKITITLSDKDSVKQVIVKLTNADTAVKGIDVHFYVKKSFGLLPLAGDFTTTDDNGEASVDFPTDLPGDVSGNVIVIAKVEDDEKLGNIEAVKTINWGVPVKAEQAAARSLSSSGDNAPWPLAITVTSLVVVVWGIIFYILYQLVLVKKAGKSETEKSIL